MSSDGYICEVGYHNVEIGLSSWKLNSRASRISDSEMRRYSRSFWKQTILYFTCKAAITSQSCSIFKLETIEAEISCCAERLTAKARLPSEHLSDVNRLLVSTSEVH
jgi:hypothetical protein